MRGLRAEDVDRATGVIRVERGWDRDEDAMELKSNAGRRAWAAAGLDRVTLTLDTYGHLMPGGEAQAAELAESYLSAQHDRAEEAARAAGGVLSGV